MYCHNFWKNVDLRQSRPGGVKRSNSLLLDDVVRPYYRDYIDGESTNSYRSLHITFFDNSARCYMEMQLRTKEMDDIAEIGVANHLFYEKKQETFQRTERCDFTRRLYLF